MRKLVKEPFNNWIWNSIDDYSHRVEVYYGGAGSGKSFGALQKMLLKAMNSKRRVLVIRKVGATLKDSVFTLMKELIVSSGIGPYCRVNKSDFEIELPNASVFLFKGLDDPEKIKSIQSITDIVIEEATELTLDDYTQLNLRLRPNEPYPQIYLMFNPVSKANWVYKYFFETCPEGAKIIQSTYKDNKFLAEDYCKELEAMAGRNPAYYRIYALGEFATLDKLIFPYVERRIISIEETDGLPFWCGLDFGYTNDPSALTWGRYDAGKHTVYITGEYHKKGMLNNEIAEKIRSLGLSKEQIIADSAEPKSIAELRKEGIRVIAATKGPDSIRHGLDFMMRHDIVVDERCPYTIEEFENYTWQKDRKSGEYINAPIDDWCHHIDSIRYALEIYRRPGGRFVDVKPKSSALSLRRRTTHAI